MGFDVRFHQAQLLEPGQAFLAQRFWTGVVATAVLLDDLPRRLQRPVRRGERQVGEERPALVALLEVLQQLVAEGVGGIEALRQRVEVALVFHVERWRTLEDARSAFVVGRLETIVVGGARQQREGTLETACMGRLFRLQAEVPLAGHEGLVAGLAEQLRQRHHALVEMPFVTRLAFQFRGQRLGHGADPGDVVVGAGEQHRAGRRAGRGGVEVGQAQAGDGQGVEVRRGDLAAEGADIGEAQVVGDDHQEVGAFAHARVSSGWEEKVGPSPPPFP